MEIIIKAKMGAGKLTVSPECGCTGSDGYIHVGLFPKVGDCNAIIVSAKELLEAIKAVATLAKN